MKTAFGRTLTGIGALLLATTATPAAADFGIGARAGTLGLGVDLAYGFTPLFNVRVGLNRYSYDFDFTTNDGDYQAELELDSAHALLDFHPLGGGFRITGGLLSNDNRIDASGTVSGSNVDARIDFDSSVPYAGIGWGNATRGFLPISWSIDLGIVAQGSPNVTITNSGLPPAQEQQEEQNLEDELSDFDTYPVLSAGVVFRF
ncbi:MAG: hypothetical protein R3225_08835 [Halofilum sp. (in: g-proteobacteria)]|nr:hypothetical protein [Halofilum sp. (in: g-proteobacteria)]